MKLLFVLLAVALLGTATAILHSDEIVEPLVFEIGQRVDGDKLVDLYYGESVETAQPTQHTVDINWSYANLNFIRIYVYAVCQKTNFMVTEI